MAVMKAINSTPWKAGGTIGQYEPVKLDSTEGQVVVASADSDEIIGVSLIDAVSGESVSVAGIGSYVFMRVGGTDVPSKGDKIGLDTADPTEIMTYGSTPNDQVIGLCVETAAENSLALVLLLLQVKTA